MSKLRRFAESNNLLSMLYNIPRLAKGYQPIFLDYPVRPVRRYGYGKQPHPELERILAENCANYAGTLCGFLQYHHELLEIPLRQPKSSAEPCWINKWLDGLDTLALYGFAATRNAALHIEVGSGFSTKVVRRAIRDHRLRTQLLSIDPCPRAEVDDLCDELIRQPLEQCDLGILELLGRGDTLFIDGSHRSFMNSDVTVFFLEILPRLKPGVLVHLHDIYLPLDYPPERAHWFYSEQYLLAASLLAGHRDYEVVLPNHYIATTPQLSRPLADFWAEPQLKDVLPAGSSFWIQVR